MEDTLKGELHQNAMSFTHFYFLSLLLPQDFMLFKKAIIGL